MESIKHFVVLGGGISGLSLAWNLKKRFKNGAKISLLEKTGRLGGWIETVNHEGFLFEMGPRSCLTRGNGTETLRLIEELDLQDEVIAADPAAHKRYLYCDQKLHCLPTGFFSFLFSPLMSGVIPAIWKDWRTPPLMEKDETIAEFISRRMGPHIAQRLVDPLISGIYAGDIQQLSLRSCFPLLYQWEQEYGSIARGALACRKNKLPKSTCFVEKMKNESTFSFKRGMETLVSALGSRLKEEVYLSSSVEKLQFHSEGVEVLLDNKKKIYADHLFSTLPSSALAQILTHDNEIQSSLHEIPKASVAVVCLGYRQNVLKQKGFGYLIPRNEKEEVLGVVWDSAIFPQQNSDFRQTRLTVMIGGVHMQNFQDFSKSQFQEKALEAIFRQMKICVDPDAIHIKLTQDAIPQYVTGHAKRLKILQDIIIDKYPRLSIAGNSYYGVSVNDCIARSTFLANHF